MHTKPLTKEHICKLTEYGIENIPPESCLCQYYEAGETIQQEGMPILYFSMVMRGRAKVCATAPNGKNLVLCYYVLDGVIGDIELMTDNYTATATIIAITDFECLAIPYHRNAARLKSNLLFMNLLGQTLARKLLVSSNNFAAAALYTGEERLCSYILQSSPNGIFNDILTDTACSIGMSYRHMFRILNQLCRDGLLEKQVCGYRILDREGMAGRAACSGEGNKHKPV